MATIDRAVRTSTSPVTIGHGPAPLPGKFFDTVKAGQSFDPSTGTYTAPSNGVATVTFRAKTSNLSGIAVKPALLRNDAVEEFGDEAEETETDLAATFQTEVSAGDRLQIGASWALKQMGLGGSVSLSGNSTGEDAHVEISLA